MKKQAIKRKITIQGVEYKSLESAAKSFGKPRNTVDYRISKGWTPEQAVGLEAPPDFASKTAGISVQIEGREYKTLKDAAKFYKRSYTYIIGMLKQGHSIEQAFGLKKRADTLEAEYPQLAKQWHQTKNRPLLPSDVSYGSGLKVWWECSNNHEWRAVINSRRQGSGCPYCAGQRPTSERNFATQYPELLKELDPEKNTDLDPYTITPRANKKVWWRCEKGHSWQATILNKTRKGYKGECPYCLNRKLCDDNSLAKVRSDIAKDWHPTKNNSLTPRDVVAGGSKKIWWVCKHKHEWQATVGARVISGTGCPKCTLQTSRIEIAVYSEMKALFQNVLWREKIEGYECDILIPDKKIGIEIDGVYWHRRPELDIVKQNLFHKNGIQTFRLREQGLELLSERDISFKWSANTFPLIAQLVEKFLKFSRFNDSERFNLENYIRGNSLINEKLYRNIVSQLPAPPLELSLATKRPNLAKEWAYDLNAPLSPEHFRPASNKNVWWRCTQGHVWKTSLNHRASQNTKCPACPRNPNITVTTDWNFAVINPHLVPEWHYEKNGKLRPENVKPKSNKKIWWICRNAHEWKASPSSRSGRDGTGCPYCYGRFASKENNLQALYPDVVKEWDYDLNKGFNPADLTPYVGKNVWWRCGKNKKHSWRATIYNRTKNKSGCPHCSVNDRRRYSIKDFQEFARKRGGRCRSTEYVNGVR